MMVDENNSACRLTGVVSLAWQVEVRFELQAVEAIQSHPLRFSHPHRVQPDNFPSVIQYWHAGTVTTIIESDLD